MTTLHIKRLIYQSWYRGCKETDILLGNFARERLNSLTKAELRLYESLLNEQDALIYRWVTAEAETPPHYQELVVKIREHNSQHTIGHSNSA